MKTIKEYASHDALIEARDGHTFSIWFAYIRGRVWFVEFADRAPYDLQRIVFTEVF